MLSNSPVLARYNNSNSPVLARYNNDDVGGTFTNATTSLSHHRHRRDLFEDFELLLQSPSVEWQKVFGSSQIGASFGLTIRNLLDIKIGKAAYLTIRNLLHIKIGKAAYLTIRNLLDIKIGKAAYLTIRNLHIKIGKAAYLTITTSCTSREVRLLT